MRKYQVIVTSIHSLRSALQKFQSSNLDLVSLGKSDL